MHIARMPKARNLNFQKSKTGLSLTLPLMLDYYDGKTQLDFTMVLLLSIFFTGFMVHLANHSKDRRILFADIDKRLTEIKNAVCPPKKEKDEEDKE